MFDLTPYYRKFEQVQVRSLLKKESLFLSFQIFINDPDKEIDWQSQGKFKERLDDLWKFTCFEFFLNIQGEKEYFEFNLSPQGAWNAYEFVDYRQGMKASDKWELAEFDQNQKKTWFEYSARIKVDPKLLAKPLQVALTCVLKGKNNETDYYALKHTAEKPDFHTADSRSILL